ncbi:hypothetical protein AGLY_010562 [Aphis glycines]|uniref:Uncharacterized protein n=1 Tax=Aphis glycines TaxID=307491 RepID=A0A6G0TDX5_APHGL|nr:hypothetical protein AGLY_010562 [Aphis glycines]
MRLRERPTIVDKLCLHSYTVTAIEATRGLMLGCSFIISVDFVSKKICKYKVLEFHNHCSYSMILRMTADGYMVDDMATLNNNHPIFIIMFVWEFLDISILNGVMNLKKNQKFVVTIDLLYVRGPLDTYCTAECYSHEYTFFCIPKMFIKDNKQSDDCSVITMLGFLKNLIKFFISGEIDNHDREDNHFIQSHKLQKYIMICQRNEIKNASIGFIDTKNF